MNTIQSRDSVQENLSVFSELKQRSTENKSDVGNRGYISLAILFSIYYCVFVDGVHSTHMIFLLAPD